MSSLRTVIVGTFACLFALVTAMAWYGMHPVWLQLRTLEGQRAALAQRFDHAENRLATRRAMLARLHDDPAFVERTIRSRLGYVREGEIVFRFPED